MKSILLSIVAIALFTTILVKYYEPEETSSNIELNKSHVVFNKIYE